MDDIVKRLMDSRALCSYGLAALLEEAALEIGRLRERVAELEVAAEVNEHSGGFGI